MPISAQEWRVRTGLINAGRIRTVSIFRSSKPTVSASPASHAESAASVSNSDSVPGGGSGREIVACNDQPAPQTKREAGPCYSTFINELPSSTWPWKGWSSRALRFCLAAPSPLIPTLMTAVCQILIGTKGIYAGGLYTGAEGYIVAKFVSPFDSHPFLWIVLLAAVPVVSFAALWPLFKFKQKATAGLLIHSIVSPFAEGSLCGTTTHVLFVVTMLLLLSGDVETNPGPGQRVTLKTARSALFSVRAKWRNIGIELEIDIGTLDSIEKSFHFDHTECLSRMLENWVKQTDPPPSWDALVEALESGPVGEGHLAEQIEQKYCSMSLNGHVSGKSECVPSSLAVVDVPQKSFLATTACASEYVKYLKALYTSNKLPLDNKWPPTPSKHYINLAFIDKQRVSRHEADEFTRYTIKGNIDDICQKKAPITIEKVACMQEVPFAYDPSQVEVSYPKLIVITGAPGIGKSTFAWELCRKWGNGELLQHYSLVILLRLRDKNVREAGCLADVLFQQRRPLSESLATEIEQCNGEGVLFLLEGFDELPQSLRVESSLYLDLIYGRLLPLATVLVTSRPWAISDLHWKAKDRISQQFEILGFTKQQIDEYLISVTLGDSTLLDELRRYVSLNPPIHAAMYIPLNAAIVFEVYKDRRDRTDCVIPNTMTELYTAFSLTLLIRYLHDQGEIMRKVDSIKSLPSILYKKFLGICELAFKGLKDGQFIFSDLPSGFETLGFMQSIPELHFSSGISISYNFLHLTVQEFLAAYYLSLQRDIGVQIHDESVTRFLAGITKLNNPAILPKQLPKYSVVVKASSLREEIYDELPEELPHGALRVVKTHETNVVDYVFVEYHVHLGGSTLFYESQNKAQLEASIGIETAFLEITSRMTPMECFAAGWCIGNTVCKWKLCFNETFGSISPDCMEMLHAGIRKCSPSSRSEVCELDIRDVYGSYDSLEIFGT